MGDAHTNAPEAHGKSTSLDNGDGSRLYKPLLQPALLVYASTQTCTWIHTYRPTFPTRPLSLFCHSLFPMLLEDAVLSIAPNPQRLPQSF